MLSDKWTLLLSGMADILFEGDAEPLQLNPGDMWIFRHTVAGNLFSVAWYDHQRV
ncbi:MAG: hypothetical protein ACKJSG_04685 [Lentisphaeria bacterium]